MSGRVAGISQTMKRQSRDTGRRSWCHRSGSRYDQPMTRSFLTDDQKWQIVHAPREMTDDELATAFGQLRSTVHHARWHFRTQGWTCSVSYGSCTVCGEPLLRRGFRMGKLLAHPACRAGAAPAYYRVYQQQRRDAYSGAEMKAALIRAHEHTRQGQELTKGRDHSRHQLWTPENDEAIQHPDAPPDHELALELGRTLKAVRCRRYILRQQASRDNREPLDPSTDQNL